jgi:hypothetical protein
VEGRSDAIAKFSGLSDAEWLRVLKRSVSEPVIDGILMPGFPAAEIQVGIQGSANEAALEQAFDFYRETKAYAAFCGRPLVQERRLLDFGCGWGRLIRPFMKDINPANIYGFEGLN